MHLWIRAHVVDRADQLPRRVRGVESRLSFGRVLRPDTLFDLCSQRLGILHARNVVAIAWTLSEFIQYQTSWQNVRGSSSMVRSPVRSAYGTPISGNFAFIPVVLLAIAEQILESTSMWYHGGISVALRAARWAAHCLSKHVPSVPGITRFLAAVKSIQAPAPPNDKRLTRISHLTKAVLRRVQVSRRFYLTRPDESGRHRSSSSTANAVSARAIVPQAELIP
jgi:hypothetical protein